MPAPVIARLQAELKKIVERPDVGNTIRIGGNDPYGSTPGELASAMREEYDRMEVLFKKLDIQKVR